jgi:hypothetical protein
MRAATVTRAADGMPCGGRYLLLIAAMLLLAQLAAPLVEYQFLSSVRRPTAREAL